MNKEKINPLLKKGQFYLNLAIKSDHNYYIAHYNLGYSYLK
jgi:hypothetical protein